MAKSNVTESPDVVVESRRGPLILATVKDSRIAGLHSEESGCICGDMEGPQFLVIGRNVNSERLRTFAKREEIDQESLISFKDSIKLPEVSLLPSFNLTNAFAEPAKPQMVPVQ